MNIIKKTKNLKFSLQNRLIKQPNDIEFFTQFSRKPIIRTGRPIIWYSCNLSVESF